MADDVRRYLSEGEQAGARYRLTLPRSASQGSAGNQLARSVGASMEFMDHREYQPGDDLRRLDWSAFARTNKLIVKLYRQEVCPCLELIIDGSHSMALTGTEKLRATLGLAAALSCAAENSGYSRRVYLTGDGCRPIGRGGDRPANWQGLKFQSRESPAESFRILPPAWRPRTMRILVSDLLWLGDPLEVLSPLADRSSAVVVIQLLAADDVDPIGLGNQRVQDCETGAVREMFIDASGQQRFRQNLTRHQNVWQAAARKVGASLVPLIAEDLCRSWDLSPLIKAEALAM
jgi:uncharacterized protein (DUF58 family)